MDRNRFNTEVRPYLTEIPIGEQGVAFDRLDLDAWVEQYKSRNGRPAQAKGDTTWDANAYQDSLNAAGPGTLTRKSEDADFAKALEKAYSGKQKNTLLEGSKKSGKRKSMG
jgi:hypothetical protein